MGEANFLEGLVFNLGMRVFVSTRIHPNSPQNITQRYNLINELSIQDSSSSLYCGRHLGAGDRLRWIPRTRHYLADNPSGVSEDPKWGQKNAKPIPLNVAFYLNCQ